MACDCINNMKKLLTEKFGFKADIDSSIFSDGTQRFNIKGFYDKPMKNGRTKQVDVNIYAKYCPLCGKPYNEQEVKED